MLSPLYKTGRCVSNVRFHRFYLSVIFNVQIEIRCIRFRGENCSGCLSGLCLCVVLRDDTDVSEEHALGLKELDPS